MDDKLDDLIKQEMRDAIGMDGSPLFDLDAPEGTKPDPVYVCFDRKLLDVSNQTYRDLAERRALLKLNLENLEQDRENRLTEIAPSNGWGGSNDSTRKLSREKAALEDVICAQIGVLMLTKRGELAAIDAELEIRDQARRVADQELRKREADQRDRELAVREREVAVKEYECSLE